MRVESLGKDEKGNVYWYFYGNRLYRESPEPVKEEKTDKKFVQIFLSVYQAIWV